jgi:hypothetical protein
MTDGISHELTKYVFYLKRSFQNPNRVSLFKYFFSFYKSEGCFNKSVRKRTFEKILFCYSTV